MQDPNTICSTRFWAETRFGAHKQIASAGSWETGMEMIGFKSGGAKNFYFLPAGHRYLCIWLVGTKQTRLYNIRISQ